VAQGPQEWSIGQSAGFAITDGASLGRAVGPGPGRARGALLLVTTWALGAGGQVSVTYERSEPRPV
jgi:hypothetical protein